MNNTTIAAISTPLGCGGIGIIRISGNRSVTIADTLFQGTQKRGEPGIGDAAAGFVSHRFYHGHILDPDTRERLDEVLLVVMRAPRSYTREDVVEIHSHSGPVVLGQIYEKVITAGAAMAEAGEFTRRAFLNGRIDLTQAEAVADIINAKTGTALKIANRQLAGHLTEKIVHIREILIDLRSALEAHIEFAEDVGDEIQSERMIEDLEKGVIGTIEDLLRNYETDHFYRDGVKMAVIGRPNVGKSSLMNRLIQRDRAIVTALPGTTRDIIEETVHINGLPVVIMDTAGIHEAQGEIEKIGIKKTRESINDADIILFMLDDSQPLQTEDTAIYRDIADKKHLIVQNKVDLSPRRTRLNLPKTWERRPVVRISALKGTHIETLRQMIWKTIVGDAGINREIGILPNLRHKKGLEQCLGFCRHARRAMEKALPVDMLVTDIMAAIEALDMLLGDRHRPEILDTIFSRFCIGK